MNTLTKIASAIALTSTLAAGQAMAATQGSLAATSTGKSDITLSIVDQVQITGVNDIALGTFDGTNNLTGGDSFCVYRSGAGDYTMTVSADGKATLEVASGAGDTIAFTAKVDGDNDASDGSAIAHGGTSAAYAGSDKIDCNSTDNAAIQVDFAAADLRAANTANYTATLVILVEPI